MRSILENCFLVVLFWMLFQGVTFQAFSQRIDDFELKDAGSGKLVTLKEHSNSKAVVMIFTALNCPFSKLYDDRIVALHENFSVKGIAFLLINPHGGQLPEEQSDKMAEWMGQRKIGMPFLIDEKQLVTKMMGVSKIPEVVVVTSGPTGYSIVYRGAIDNNPQSAQSVRTHYLENALNSILSRGSPSPASTRPIGCNVRPL